VSQGALNGKITKLANNPKALKELMADKNEEQIRLGRLHLKQVLFMQRKMK